MSRSHFDAGSAAFLNRLADISTQPCGSALKFCRLAEGAADIYPRLSPTAEWDVAAGHAVLEGAGGTVVVPGGSPLRYGRAVEGFRIPQFLAFGDPMAAARLLPH